VKSYAEVRRARRAARQHTVEPANAQRLRDYGTQVLAVAGADVTKLRHDPMELLTRAVQPVLWLLLFGEVMAQVRGLSTGDLHYLDFLSASILAQGVPVRGLSQALIVYLLALLIGVGIDLSPLHMIGVVAIIALGSGLFATLSLIIACIVKTRERSTDIGEVLTLPIFFRQQCHLSALLDASLAASSLPGQPPDV
jgi:ABC-2 type transport system permease protein